VVSLDANGATTVPYLCGSQLSTETGLEAEAETGADWAICVSIVHWRGQDMLTMDLPGRLFIYGAAIRSMAAGGGVHI